MSHTDKYIPRSTVETADPDRSPRSRRNRRRWFFGISFTVILCAGLVAYGVFNQLTSEALTGKSALFQTRVQNTWHTLAGSQRQDELSTSDGRESEPQIIPAVAADTDVLEAPNEPKSNLLVAAEPDDDLFQASATPASVDSSSDDPARLFAAATAAHEDEVWLEAIDLYEQLRAVDSGYKSNIVTRELATAYLNAAMQTVTDAPDADIDLELTREYFRNVLALIPGEPTATAELELLNAYLAGERTLRLGSPNETIDFLSPVYEALPQYLGGQAAETLYKAYLDLGDSAMRQGENSAASELFEQANSMDVTDKSEAVSRLTSLNALKGLTPTPFPKNLPTVQAVAIERRLPPVLLETPTPKNDVEATGRAQYATAVAVTTGTFTPVPKDFVTPMLVMPSPPSESVATDAARVATATAIAGDTRVPTPTQLPYNAVIAEYIYATVVPENAATAAAQAVIAEANTLVNGTPTAISWGVVMITAVPTTTPNPPTAVPTGTPLPLVLAESQLTATPTPLPTYVVPDTLPPELRNKIIFLSDRGGRTQTYMFDPVTRETSLVTQDWVHPMAQEELSLAPDGNRQAIVQEDHNRVLQIKIYDPKYDAIEQVTAVNTAENIIAIAYDPAWSPSGDKIAYVSTESWGDEIYTVDISANNAVRRLTENSWEWDKHPSWSPDGTQIVFYSNRDSGRRQLWIMNADGSDQRNLSSNEYNDWDPVWTR